jgi:hypothetical protein
MKPKPVALHDSDGSDEGIKQRVSNRRGARPQHASRDGSVATRTTAV